MCVFVCYEYMPWVCWWIPDDEVTVTLPQSGVWGSCELPDLGAGNCAQVLWRKQQALITTEPPLQPQERTYLLYPLLPLAGEKWHWRPWIHGLQDEVFREGVTCPGSSKDRVSDTASYLVGLMIQPNKSPLPPNTDARTNHKVLKLFFKRRK